MRRPGVNANHLIKFEANCVMIDLPPASHAEHHAAIALRLMSLLLTTAVADREKCPGDRAALPEKADGDAAFKDRDVPSLCIIGFIYKEIRKVSVPVHPPF